MLSCRIEKGYRHWGHDIGPDDDPLACGLSFAVGWDKANASTGEGVDFVGRAALEAIRTAPKKRRLLHFAIEDSAAMLHHEEPIFRDGERMGLITSGTWGHTVGAAVGLGWAARPGDGEAQVDPAWIREGAWEIEIAGRMNRCRASHRTQQPCDHF